MKKILVIFHLYYKSQLPYFLEKFGNIDPVEWDLIVTGSDLEESDKESIRAFKRNTVFLQTDAVGYDIWPFIQAIRSVNLNDYSVVMKFHTKNFVKDDFIKMNGRYLTGYMWRDILVDALLESPARVSQVMKIFEEKEDVGMIVPATLLIKEQLPEDGKLLDDELSRIGLNTTCRNFCAGSMFAVRASLLDVLVRADINAAMFPGNKHTRSGGTLSHVYERILTLLVPSQGYSIYLIDNSLRLRLKKTAGRVLKFVFSLDRKGPHSPKYLTILGIDIKLDNGF